MSIFEKRQKRNTNLIVETKSGTSTGILTLLENTVFGTKGKVRYHQKNIGERIEAQKNIEFIQIKKRDQVLGTTGVVTRSTTGIKDNFKSLFIRYLSVNNPFRKHEKKRTPHSQFRNIKANSSLKTLIGKEITDHFEQPIIEAKDKAAFYAFVESENFNSKELCINLGFYPARKVSTILFSRFYPKKEPPVSEIEDFEKEEVSKHLSFFYQNHSFYFEDRLFESGTYYVLKRDGKIVAGIRCRPVNWEIVEVPGFSGFLMQRVLPYLPLTNKLFNPKNLNFLAFDYAWCLQDDEELILTLMNHACSVNGIHLGMFWGDTESTLVDDLKKSNRLGFLYKLNGEVNAEVMLRFINLNEAEQSELLKKPVFVSALDMT